VVGNPALLKVGSGFLSVFPFLEENFSMFDTDITLLKSVNSSYSSSDHEVRPINDLFRPHDFIRPVVSLMVMKVFFR